MLPRYLEFTDDPAKAVKHLCGGFRRVVLLADDNTRDMCLPLLATALPDQVPLIVVPPGEEHKTLSTCELIWSQLTRYQADRNTLLLILGGGVLGDMGGFCAATFKRGIPFALLPTTLLAQVDSSIGGKLGIDFQHLKNHIGVFRLPHKVILYSGFLNTLPEAELKSGFAEIVKHVLISDRTAWSKLYAESWNESLSTWIRHSVELKANITAKDPEEAGLRKILNAGHTAGHAFESWYLETGNKILHGEAVAMGLVVEAGIAVKKGLLSAAEARDIREYLFNIFTKNEINLEQAEVWYDKMKQDKKNAEGEIRMVLLNGIGKAEWDHPVTAGEFIAGLKFYAD